MDAPYEQQCPRQRGRLAREIRGALTRCDRRNLHRIMAKNREIVGESA